MDAEPVVIEAHVGWRDELWDETPRVHGGVEVGVAGWALELNGGARFLASDYSGHLVAQELQPNDASWWVMRDDRFTAGGFAVWRPWWRARVGPSLALGGEVGSTRTIAFNDNVEGGIVGRSPWIPTAWLTARLGVEARVGAIGARLTTGPRMSWLARPEQFDEPESVAFVEIWTVGVDLLVRLK